MWALPALTAAGLGGWRLTGPALWADELATWGAVRLSWSQLWQLTGTVDVVLLPYYALLKGCTALAGTGTAALRLPSVVAVTATTIVVTALGRRAGAERAGAERVGAERVGAERVGAERVGAERVGAERVGLLAGLMFALIPVTSRMAQEARPYALTMLGAALTVLCLIRLMEAPSAGRAVAYAAATAATGLLHPLSGLLMLAGHAVAIVWRQFRHNSDGWRATVLWLAAAGVGALPAVVLGLRGRQQAAQISWITLADVNTLQGLPQHLFASAAVGGMTLALAVVGVRRGLPALCLVGAGFVPPALLLIIGTQVPIWVARYVLLAVPALAVLAGVGAARAGRPQAALAILLTATLSFPAHLDFRTSAGHGPDYFKIAQVIGPHDRPGDVAVFTDTHPSTPWASRDIYERYLPAPRPPDILRIAAPRTDGHFLARECPDAACLGTPPRIWVIRVDSPADPLKDMRPAKRLRISEHYRTVRSWKYSMLGITLLERTDNATR